MLVMLMIRPQRCFSMEPITRLDQQEWRGQVGVDYVVPVGALHAHDQLIAGDAGIVDQNVDLAEARDHGLRDGLDLLFIADVELERRRLAAFAVDLVGQLLQLLLIAGAQRHLRARLGQHQRARAANALRRSGYQRDPAFNSCHEASLETKQDYNYREVKDLLRAGVTQILTDIIGEKRCMSLVASPRFGFLQQPLWRPEQHLQLTGKNMSSGCGCSEIPADCAIEFSDSSASASCSSHGRWWISPR